MAAKRNFTEELARIDADMVNTVNELEADLRSSGIEFESRSLTVEELEGSAYVQESRHFVSSNNQASMSC